jgi:hypothetical protein
MQRFFRETPKLLFINVSYMVNDILKKNFTKKVSWRGLEMFRVTGAEAKVAGVAGAEERVAAVAGAEARVAGVTGAEARVAGVVGAETRLAGVAGAEKE